MSQAIYYILHLLYIFLQGLRAVGSDGDRGERFIILERFFYLHVTGLGQLAELDRKVPGREAQFFLDLVKADPGLVGSGQERDDPQPGLLVDYFINTGHVLSFYSTVSGENLTIHEECLHFMWQAGIHCRGGIYVFALF